MKIYVGEVNIKIPFAVLTPESAKALHQHLTDLISADKKISDGTHVSVCIDYKEHSL